jgi:hypothetical protein
MKRTIFTIFICFFFAILQAQSWQRNASVQVQVGNYFLANPWMGGFNAPQFSNMDIDGDGVKDIFVFDRQGNRKLVFIQTSDVTGQSYYYHAPQWEAYFPENLSTWVLLRDMNCDGFEDVVTNFQSGMVVYLNTTPLTGELSFSPYNDLNLLRSTYDLGSGAFEAPMYCMSVDIPVIEDIDGDGDLDVLSNTEASTGIYYYKSLQTENSDCNQLMYNCANRCYGMVSEGSESFNLYINEQFSCPLNVANPEKSTQHLHTGGTLAAIDLDNNGIKDVLVGDVTETNLAAVLLQDTQSGLDSAFALIPQFPQNHPVDLTLFPAAYYKDVTNDGVPDLLVSPNALYGAEDRRSVILYINQGTESLPNFVFAGNDYLQNQSIDVGFGSHPVAADVDSDGDFDLIVASRYYDTEALTAKSQIHLLLNDSLPNGEQMWRWENQDWQFLSQYQWQNIYPAWGDWDGDGDGDLLIGELNGNLYKLRNVGNVTDVVLEAPTMVFDNTTSPIDVGQSATPQLIDINLDGMLDLVVGEKSGNVNYFKNVGTVQVPLWSLVTDSMAMANASSYLGLDGYSVPWVVPDSSDIWNLYVGTEKGFVNQYQFDRNSPSSGVLIDEMWQSIREGDRSSCTFADFTRDGQLDMMYGHNGGGLAFYTTDEIQIEVVESILSEDFKIFPSPAENTIHFGPMPSGLTEVSVYDLNGRLMDRINRTSGMHTLNVSHYPRGLYWLGWSNGSIRKGQVWMKD